MERAPDSVVPMYGYFRFGWPSPASFCGSLKNGFGRVWFPFPTPTSSVLLSGVTATAVGYQPVGTNPLTTLSFCFSTSTTATQLLSAFATYSVFPSGATATASGVLPSGALGKRVVEMTS